MAATSRTIALVVEDDEEQRELAIAALEQVGYKVVAVASAEEAIASLEDLDERLTFVFADIRLAGKIDGIALATFVRERYPWAKIILTSGSGPGAPLPTDVSFVMKPWNAVNLMVDAEIAKMN